MPFIGALRIQEPIILCEPQIMTSHKRLARVLTAGDGGFVNRCMRMADIQMSDQKVFTVN